MNSASTSGLWTGLIMVMAVWAVTVVTPGPNFLATAHATLTRSRQAGLLVVAGITVGTALWGTASLFGLGLLFQTAGGLYQAVKLAGAAYLVYVGVRLILSARRASAPMRIDGPAIPASRAFRHGLVTDLSNPKAAAFFTSLFAVAVPPTAPLWFDAMLVTMVTAVAGIWYGMVACALAVDPVVAFYRKAARAITALAGVVFVGLGLRLAAER
jgi:threonine/homoserine/homoserine lactone efflux protein